MKWYVIAAVVATVSGAAIFSWAGDGAHCNSKKSSGEHREAKAISVDPALSKDARVEAYKKKYPDISHRDLVSALDKKNVVVVDANGLDTRKKNHIPGAYTIHDTKQLLKALPDNKDALIVTYCGSPKCTAWFIAADYVSGLGYTNVKHYSEGIKGWVKKTS
jgi:rhodanese-related sulfurtransferase